MSALSSIALTEYIKLILADNPSLSYFYNQLYGSYNPDITGYTLIFMVPPEFSSVEYEADTKLNFVSLNSVESLLSPLGLTQQKITSLNDFAKIVPFLATEFTPPQTEVQNAQVQSRTGAMSYATDVHETETVSISYIESNPLTIYKFHLLWIDYIREILKGAIEPASKYIDPLNQDFGIQDYLASFYIVKYIPDLSTISYVSKCIGVFPLRLPSKELIGTRTTNEICVLPFEYSCIAFRECIIDLNINQWILTELNSLVLNRY